MWDQRLKLYDDPHPEENGHEPYIQELLELQAKVQSKHIITVEAPQVQGKHDDMSDADSYGLARFQASRQAEIFCRWFR